MEEKLYNRELSCGHNRLTYIAFLCKNYERPEVGDKCYCRECNEESDIIKVTQESDEDVKRELKNNKTLFGASNQPNKSNTKLELKGQKSTQS